MASAKSAISASTVVVVIVFPLCVCVCVLYQTVDPPSTPRVALGDPRVNGGLENGQCNDDLGDDDDDFHCVSLCVVVVCMPPL